jgi:multiple sugar transport system substrate-binding protein
MRGEITRRGVLLGGAAAAATALAGCGGTGGTVNGVTTIVLWHGQNDVAKATVERLVAEFNRTHPYIRVQASSGGVLADGMLQKVMASLAAGSYPDLAYVFGSNLANLARSWT